MMKPIEALVYLYENGPICQFGICQNYHRMTGESINVLFAREGINIKDWQFYSGRDVYWIPSDLPHISPKDTYSKTPDLWKGRQGYLRKSFIRWVLWRLGK